MSNHSVISPQKPPNALGNFGVFSAPSGVKIEPLLVIAILLIAAAFRLIALNDVPPGLHHDEVIIGQEAKDILSGHLSIYFAGGYGQEPLYHYLTAGLFAFISANAFVLRLGSAFTALIGLAITYRFTRKFFSPTVAIGTLAWMSISLWPIFFSRVGLRGITLPVLTTLTAYFLWRALNGGRTQQYILAGAFLGLSIYTYQASRVFPVIFLVFFIYLFITRRLSYSQQPARRFSFQSSSFIFFFLTAALVTAPLIIYLTIINPSAEQRIDALSGPLNKLAAGNPSEVIQSTLNTLGMFTLRGDAVPIYNVSDRPVFPDPISAALFYLGLLVCLWRWKKPQYALMSIWFFISLGPAMITPFSPNFVRTIASWPIPFVFAGIGMDEALQIAGRQGLLARLRIFSLSRILALFFAVVLIYNSFSTARDYFINWPTGDYVRFWQQATWTQAVRTLNADPSTETVAASGLSINTFDPQTFDLLGLRWDIKVEWFDCRNAILFPAGRTIRYLIPAFFPCDQDLWSLFLQDAKLLNQPNWPGTQETIFALYDFERSQSLAERLASHAVFPPVYIGSERFEVDKPLQPIETWVDFGGLRFCGPWIDQFTGKVVPKPGATVLIDTCWKLMQPVAPPLKIFVHITAPDGKIFAQWDGLDVNVGTLEPGDVFIQRHPLKLPSDLPSGPYRISLGVYNPDTDARLKAIINGQTIDSIVLGPLDVTS